MTMIDYEDNISWEPPPHLDGWEPWEDYGDDEPAIPSGACHYCLTTENVREVPDPFGGKPCCETCFARLIGDESDDPQPFRCLNCSPDTITPGSDESGGGLTKRP